MNTLFKEVSDVLADERFLSYYFKDDEHGIDVWESMMAADPGLSDLTTEAIVLLKSLPSREVPVERRQVEESLGRLRVKRDQAPVVRLRTGRTWWVAAAAVAVLLVAGAILFQQVNRRAVIVSSYGQLSTNQLPDGSTLILNAHSEVHLSNDWKGTNDREVWLDGEAFFKVAKTPEKRRFIVHTDKLDVIVTGTQFNVSTRDNRTTVLLTEGSVTLKMKNGKEMKMKPGDFVVMNDEEISMKPAMEENILAWKDNRMGFDSTSFEEVGKTISNHYGVRVIFGDEAVKQQTLSGIMKNNNLDELLKAIELMEKATIQRKDDVITISSKQ